MIKKTKKLLLLRDAGPPAKLKLLKKPNKQIENGNKLDHAVQVLDAFQNRVDTNDIQITAQVEGDDILEGQRVVSTQNGIAKFDNLFVSKVLNVFFRFLGN